MSMNSIVIIILAVVFVSLVLVFFQNVFGEQQKNVLNVIDQFPSVNPPTSVNPLKVQAEDPVSINIGESSARTIPVEYLHLGDKQECGASISEATITDTKVKFILPSSTVQLDDGGKVAFSITAMGQTVGTTVYQIEVCCKTGATPLITKSIPNIKGESVDRLVCDSDNVIRSVQKAFVVKR